MMCSPPSTNSVVPVIKEASVDAIQRIGYAISSGEAQRPISDVSFRSDSRSSMLFPLSCAYTNWNSVSVEPGQTALALTPLIASSKANDRVYANCAALVAS